MFTHLHTHSYYSFNAGTIAASDLPELAKRKGMTTLALTDTNNMSGAFEFYFAAKKAGVKPILGVELKTRYERAVLLAKNNAGYREMNETLSRVMEAIPFVKPKLTLEDVDDKRTEILPDDDYVPLAPFLKGLSHNLFIVSSTPEILIALSGRPNVFIELIPAERKLWDVLRHIYKNERLPVVATNNVFMESPQDYDLHTLLRAIGSNTTLGNTPHFELADPSQYFTDEATFRVACRNIHEEAFRNIELIAEQCNIEFDTSYNKFARFQTADPFGLLKSLSEQGFAKRYKHPTGEHRSRFEYELQTIEQLGATSYFLAVHDMLGFAKSKNIPHLGRGSGANSIIAYCLEISNVDPVVNNLRFERFLNPERTSAPDFDIDFSWTVRYEIINYMLDKYGRDSAAMLSTINCYRDRGGVREIGKALGYTEAEINQTMGEVRAYGRTGELDRLESVTHTDVQQWLQWASRIEGYPRHLSVHAGGIVIGDKPLANYCALQQAPIGVPITQIDMFSAEDIKLIKLDILATRGLGTYWDTMALVEERTGVRPPVEDETVAFSDEATKESIRIGKTRGCFYIESPAMIGLLRKLETDTFENLTAASSVIRPGVAQSGMMDEFIHRRHLARTAMAHHLYGRILEGEPKASGRRKDASKPIPALLELLPETFGVMVYQEDVLTVVHDFAGLSYGEADLFRRSMSGKLRSHERMSAMKSRFIEGALSKGHTVDAAEEVWRQVSSFAGYSFCKAHSASYAVLSFQEAWLKVHYPAEFICSVLNNFGGYYNHQEYINEAKLLGLTVKIPDVNWSEHRHTVDASGAIRLGMVAFRKVSQRSIQSLLDERERGGRYTSIEDFALRSGVSHEDGMALIKLGACESFESERARGAMKFGLLSRQRFAKTQQYALDYPVELGSYNFAHLSEPDALTIFHREKEYLGYAVTNHPCDFLDAVSEETIKAAELSKYIGKTISIVGYRAASKGVTTRTGKAMLMLNIADHTGMVDVTVWNEQYMRYYTELSTGQAYRITGRVQESFGVPSLEARTIDKLEYEEHSIESAKFE
jgi:DNA polymerase-3 subunit alpha